MRIKQITIDKIKKEFGLETVTLEEFKDKYGLMINIKELNSCNYKRVFEEHVERLVEEHQYAKSKHALKKLREIAKVDNYHARFLSKREYKVVKVFTCVEPFLGYGVLIKFKDNGELRYMYESGLCYCLCGRFEKEHEKNTPWYYGRKNRSYFTAGGIKDKDVDFIFHGVGFSTKVDMYNRNGEKVID